MGRRRATLLQRGIDASTHDAHAVHDGPGDLSDDCVTMTGVGACGNRSPLFPSGGGQRSSVHGRVSAQATVDSRTVSANFNHLTGHYRSRAVQALRLVLSNFNDRLSKAARDVTRLAIRPRVATRTPCQFKVQVVRMHRRSHKCDLNAGASPTVLPFGAQF